MFAQLIQVHLSSQKRPIVKHSQYILRHLDFVHLHLTFSQVVLFYFNWVNYRSRAIVDCLMRVFLPGPRVRFLVWEDSPCDFSLLILGIGLLSFCVDAFNMESYLICVLNLYLSSNLISLFLADYYFILIFVGFY